MCKATSSLIHESRAQTTGSSKACIKSKTWLGDIELGATLVSLKHTTLAYILEGDVTLNFFTWSPFWAAVNSWKNSKNSSCWLADMQLLSCLFCSLRFNPKRGNKLGRRVSFTATLIYDLRSFKKQTTTCENTTNSTGRLRFVQQQR